MKVDEGDIVLFLGPSRAGLNPKDIEIFQGFHTVTYVGSLLVYLDCYDTGLYPKEFEIWCKIKKTRT